MSDAPLSLSAASCIGRILCTDKNEAMVRYTMSQTTSQVFASRCQLHLPSEDELRAELRREQELLATPEEE